MITTTLGALVLADTALADLKALRLPVKPAYHVMKLCRLVTAEVEGFHTQRNAIIDELGVERATTDDERAARNGAATLKQVPPDRLAAFRTRLDELAAIAVTIPWDPIALDWLMGAAVSPQTLLDLGACLGEPAPPPPSPPQ